MFGSGFETMFKILFFLAGIGVIASFVGGIWLIYEMIIHLHWL